MQNTLTTLTIVFLSLFSAVIASGCFGKWHIGEHYPSHPNGQGFDEFFGMPQGHWDNFFDPELEHNGKEPYDHRSDPHEWHNLANDPKHAEVIQRLAQGIPHNDAP